MRVWDARAAIYRGLCDLEWRRYLAAMWIICGELQALYPERPLGQVRLLESGTLDLVRQVALTPHVPPEAVASAGELHRRWEDVMPALDGVGVGESHMWQVFADLCGEIAGVFRRHMAGGWVMTAATQVWLEQSQPPDQPMLINDPDEEAADGSPLEQVLVRLQEIVDEAKTAADIDPEWLERHSLLRGSSRRDPVDKGQFLSYAGKNGINFKPPVDRLPGMTETILPVGSAGEFNDMGLFMMDEGDKHQRARPCGRRGFAWPGSFDGEQVRRDTPGYPYSDLLFFCSLGGSSAGAVAGRLENGRVQIRSRARYAAIAQDLGLAAVVCFLPADTPRSLLDEFLLTPGVRLAGAPDSDDSGASVQWHTVAFAEDVTGDGLARIERELSEVFGHPIELHRAGPDGSTIYFQALTREDHDQAVSFMAALREFDQEIAPIRSYRGGRFQHVP